MDAKKKKLVRKKLNEKREKSVLGDVILKYEDRQKPIQYKK